MAQDHPLQGPTGVQCQAEKEESQKGIVWGGGGKNPKNVNLKKQRVTAEECS